MCAGGVVGDKVFNKVVDNVIILRNGTSPGSYRDICPVRVFLKLENDISECPLGNPFFHYNLDGR